MDETGYLLPRNLHFIGIGGVGMSGLALIAHEQGYVVSGSDIIENEAIARLKARGVKVFLGHRLEQVWGAEAVIVSSAIPEENEELKEAKRLNLPIILRGDMLASLVNDKKGIVVAGTHGKTTTTSMISLLFEIAGLDPTVSVGGELEDIGGNAKAGKGGFFIAEADESDGSFLKLNPFCAVVTNIEDDHLSFYGDMEKEKEAFVRFLHQIKEGGFGVVCQDHPTVRSILPYLSSLEIVTYGREGGDIRGRIKEKKKNGFLFQVDWKGKKLADFELRVPGLHNVNNALASIAVGLKVGIGINHLKEAISSFRGVKRRFEKIGRVKGALVIDDYAHHPTEMLTVWQTALDYAEGSLVVIFQPHRYTRTKQLYREMARVLEKFHQVFILPVYSAGEKPIPGISAELIYREMRKNGFEKVQLVESPEEAAQECLKILKPEDLVVTMGAGDVWKVGLILCSPNGGK
ncbi:MAG TPA: UDP-N-acetylmuramate--L-alanine ligase [Candidatus Atribacteria bacterium]|nr:UDP-N-acetylmuramate--L-alanine ligase [Candidatus Atribacteria bacterium]HQE24650.1 UDP-N-acetylmuramate--L-alanine ligase [Candidatus Atribacteria bacterium]